MLYACDHAWWKIHIENVNATFSGEKWTQDRTTAKKYGLHHVCGLAKAGLSKEPGVVHFGSSSGYQAINLAFLWGFRKIILLGFDCKATDKRHWFGNHPKGLSQNHPYHKWIKNFTVMARDLSLLGVEVINCSPNSALKCWPKMTIEQALHIGDNNETGQRDNAAPPLITA